MYFIHITPFTLSHPSSLPLHPFPTSLPLAFMSLLFHCVCVTCCISKCYLHERGSQASSPSRYHCLVFLVCTSVGWLAIQATSEDASSNGPVEYPYCVPPQAAAGWLHCPPDASFLSTHVLLSVSHGAISHEGTLWKFRALESQALDMK